MKTFLVASLLLMFVSVSYADSKAPDSKGSDLSKFCETFTRESAPSVEKAYCRGYVVGWRMGIEGTLVSDEQGFQKIVTFEDNITDSQMAKVFVLYMTNHPEEENKPAHVALMHALVSAGLVTLASPSGK